jgi:elongation factor Ts
MPAITAAMVNELRARTGQGMMECKRMLQQTAGDVDRAIDEFRKKGIKTSITERIASEGRVIGVQSQDGAAVALVEINCNTDFTAKSEPFMQLGAKAAQLLLHNPDANVAQAAEVSADVKEVTQQTGENIRIGKSVYLKAPEGGKTGLYLYSVTSKIGVGMVFTGNPSDELIKQLGGHIAFARPMGLSRGDIPEDIVAKEREIAVEQAKATGKPQNIAEKIAEGKLNAFFAERALLDQEFFNAQVFKGSISKYLQANKVTLVKYQRLEVGQQ